MNPPYHSDGDWIAKLAEKARILGEARMLRDDEPITDEKTAAVLQRFKEYLERSGLSQEKAAKSMGFAAGTLSTILSGTYAGDAESFVRKIDKWIEHRVRKEQAPKDPGFVKHKVAQQIYGVAKWVAETGCIGMVTGPAGIGKTRTLKALRSDFPGSIYICITRSGQSNLSVLDLIARELRLPGMKLSAWQLHQAVADVLRDTQRLILVDEAHRLAGRKNDEALHGLRDVYDASGSTPDTCCPMLLAGMGELANYINEGQKRYERLEQLDSRIGLRLDLTEAANEVNHGGPGLFTIKDIEAFLAAQKIRVAPDALAYLQQIANEPRLGHLRTVDWLLKFARAMAEKTGGKPITADMLRSIFTQQRGRRFVEAVEQQMQLRVAAG